MSKRKSKPQAAGLPISGRDLPLCLVRPILAMARLSTPGLPEALVRATLASISLNIAEKHQMLSTQLCDFQITALERTFAEECGRVGPLFADHPEDLLKLQALSVMENFLLAASYGHAIPVRIERALIARMVRRIASPNLDRALATIPAGWWSRDAASVPAVVWHSLCPSTHAARIRARQAEPDPLAEAV